MAGARRNKRQAKRNTDTGTPAWVWLIAIAAVAAVVFMAMPGLFKGEGDGFLRAGPRPNPDAVPAQVADADIDAPASLPRPAARGGNTAATDTPSERPAQPSYDFYTLLPGSEVQMSDAELAATARAEAERLARNQRQATPAESPTAPANQPAPVNENPAPVSEAQRALAALEGRAVPKPAAQPAPVNERPAASERSVATTTTAAPATRPAAAPAAASTPATTVASAAEPASNVRYLLQAGAFSAQGEAEGTKARLAMAGVGARVEPAQINGTTVYRVRMGPYNSASDLAAAKAKLEAAGLQAMAIKAQ